MASNVANVVGTARQFSPQPESTYQKRLQGVSAPNGGISAERTSAGRLASALGVFGDSILETAVTQQKNKETRGLYYGKMAIASTSKEDLDKLKAIDIAGQCGLDALIHNPWGLNYIERWRGNNAMSQALAEYQTDIVNKEGRMKTAQEEAARFENYCREKLPNLLENSSIPTAFLTGYTENLPAGIQQQVNAQVQWKTAEAEAERDGTALATCSENALNSLNYSVEELKTKSTEMCRDWMVTQAPLAKRIQWFTHYAEEVAQCSYSPEKINALKDVVLYTNVEDGTEVKAGSVIDFAPIETGASSMQRNMANKWTMDETLKIMQFTTKKDCEDYAETLKTTNPDAYRTLLPAINSRIEAINTAEKQKSVAAMEKACTDSANQMGSTVLNAQLTGFLNGMGTDGKNLIATSRSTLPKVLYQNAKGELKEKTISEDEVNTFLSGACAKIYADQSLTQEQKQDKILKVLSWGVASDFINSANQRILSAFDSGTAEEMLSGNDVWSVQSAMEMYHTNPSRFSSTFSDEVVKKVWTINSLIGGNNNNLQQGITLYTQARDNLRDPNKVAEYNKSLAAYRPNVTLTMHNMRGGEESMPLYSGDGSLNSMFSTLYLYNCGAGFSQPEASGTSFYNFEDSVAYQNTQKSLNDSYWVYEGNIFPRDVFAGINVQDKGMAAAATLDNLRTEYGQTHGVDPDSVSVTWNSATRKISMMAYGYPPMSYTPDEFKTRADADAAASMVPPKEGESTFSKLGSWLTNGLNNGKGWA